MDYSAAGGCSAPIPAPSPRLPQRARQDIVGTPEWVAAKEASYDADIAASWAASAASAAAETPHWSTFIDPSLNCDALLQISQSSLVHYIYHPENSDMFYRLVREVAKRELSGKSKDNFIHSIEKTIFTVEKVKEMRKARSKLYAASRGEEPFSPEEKAAYQAKVLATFIAFQKTLYGMFLLKVAKLTFENK